MASMIESVAGATANAMANITNALSSASLNGTRDDIKEAAQTTASEGRRLYIGNLAYATTEDQLKESFVGYNVESIAIPKNPRTERPVGYAFVDVSSPQEAERAIAELSGKEILERKVSVQLARVPSSTEKTERNGDRGDRGDGNRRRSSNGNGRGRGGRFRGGRNRSGAPDGNQETAPAKEASVGSVGVKAVKALGDITNRKPADRAIKTEDKPRGSRRERGPPSDGVPSKTKVMVANIPFDMTEEKLKEMFAAYEPSSAKIALRPMPRFLAKKLQARGEARKGRGFGFVTLGSEELQQKAVAEMNGKMIGEREMAVKIAIDSPDKPEAEDKSSAQSDKAAESVTGHGAISESIVATTQVEASA